MTDRSGGFDALSGAGDRAAAATPPPDGIRTMSPQPADHGHPDGAGPPRRGGVQRVGRVRGPARLPGADRAWPRARSRGCGTGWPATGELAGTDALYASVLPRAIETAELLAPALRRRRARLRTSDLPPTW